jgi:putative transposase
MHAQIHLSYVCRPIARETPCGVESVSDNGTELTSMAILRWSQERRVEWHYIAPGKPQQNAFAESFIGRLERDPVQLAQSRAGGSGDGRTTTTPLGHTAVSAICRRPRTRRSAFPRRNGTGRCATPRALRPIPLLRRTNKAQIWAPPRK